MTSSSPTASRPALVRIGGASGFWGDSSVGPRQLVDSGRIDYLVFDYLAETTMAVLAAARLRRPELGYATDFVDVAMRDVLADCAARGIKVVSNAGGIHPEGCAAALRALADELGIAVRIAVVLGDDVAAQMPALHAAGTTDMASGEPLPARVLSANAYLGAQGVRAALAAGAQVVITGRCVDSAVTLGPLMHEFGWADDDWDRLAGGSLAGHIIECGCQATGGLHTDWRDIPDWPAIGYPIVDCRADGSFSLTKPAGTGGRLLRAAVAEQLLYEIGDPGAYLLPDVSCDFRQVVVTQRDADHVDVRGARGRPPPVRYKVSATVQDGWRCAGSLVVIGIDAAAKARRTGEAIVARTRQIFEARGIADYTAIYIEVIGAESLYGPHARTGGSREVMLRVVADHASKAALEIFAREVAPAGTSWSPGTTGPGTGRPAVSPLIKPLAFLLAREAVTTTLVVDGARSVLPPVPLHASVAVPPVAPPPDACRADDAALREVPLIALAWARSGDKGDISNIGVVARRPEWLPWIWRALTASAVHGHFAHLMQGDEVQRFHLPGIAGMNLLLQHALAGGGPRSPRMDPLGKGMAQMLLDLPIRVPADIARAADAAHSETLPHPLTLRTFPMLHPQARALIDLMAARGVPPTHTVPPAEARTFYRERRGFTQPDAPEVAEVRDLTASTPQGAIPLRLYRPRGASAAAVLPVLVYYHGGGWVIGDLDTHDTLCRELANGAGCAVVAVDYRMGPEHRFPAAVNDVLAATRWVRANAASLGVDAARLAVGGDSAGGNLAAVVALEARDAGDLPIAFQLLIYPATDMRRGHASHVSNGEGYGLTKDTLRYFHDHYITDPAHDLDWRASPLLRDDLQGLPPALLITAGYDPLRDEGLDYARALTAAGNRVSHVCFERQIHGFVLMGRVLDEAHTAVALCATELRRALAPRD